VAQRLREATPWAEGPRCLIRDNDQKCGGCFDTVATGTGITILRTPVRAPNANAVCARFLRSVRAECLDHVLILDADHLASILRRSCAYFNEARPHQGIAQKSPNGPPEPPAVGATVAATPILGGLHHDHRRAA
jgi:transposase InsO family protein